ncbi:MAG: 3-phosphoshikimate 1-carboxyvinyltransferase [Spirochaetaceae bacterium]|nr:3-phosphoshikimate 1-carboxyvinyltransferase [Spirochaetaceae bacterium]MBR6566836.1 3-phosphoshikimate 1-carboxyvinyltransferase [Spirochaetaceae bacterium]
MNCIASSSSLSGSISVPGSKSHTIRACLLAALAEGTSIIYNPLPSADCLSALRCITEIGARVEKPEDGKSWVIHGAGKDIHLPDNVIDVGNSGSVLYFLSPIAATFSGWSIFTGDESIRTRPVKHLTQALEQLGATTHISRPDVDAPPLLVRGPIHAGKVVTDGGLSQYISGLMMAAARIQGCLEIELTNPKEVPYLDMTRMWLESLGIPVQMSRDYKHISVSGPHSISAFERTIPSDWEAVAFPLVAAILTDSCITIKHIDGSGSQGDEAIVGVLQSVGACLEWDKEKEELKVYGGLHAQKSFPPKNGVAGRLSAEHLPNKTLRINCSGFPDAVPALSVAACFIEGTTVIEDIAVCRKKETDRIAVMKKELTKLGAVVEDGSDYLVIHGHSPLTASGEANPDFALHGGIVESYDDHRVAMSLAVMGLALKEEVVVRDAECCAVSFPDFFKAMRGIGAGFDLQD